MPSPRNTKVKDIWFMHARNSHISVINGVSSSSDHDFLLKALFKMCTFLISSQTHLSRFHSQNSYFYVHICMFFSEFVLSLFFRLLAPYELILWVWGSFYECIVSCTYHCFQEAYIFSSVLRVTFLIPNSIWKLIQDYFEEQWFILLRPMAFEISPGGTGTRVWNFRSLESQAGPSLYPKPQAESSSPISSPPLSQSLNRRLLRSGLYAHFYI